MSTIQHINLSGIDLNLLVVLDALMTELQVTRAGERVGLSQPATSNALARLRILTGDALFVRTAQGLRPTPKAIALVQQVRPMLQGIQAALLAEAGFEPTTSDRLFAIGMSDYVEFTLLPRLMQWMLAIAPQARLQVRTGDRAKLLTLLDQGDIDLACGVFPETHPLHREHVLFHETYACVCRQNHPTIGAPLTLEDYLAASHLLVSIQEDRVGRVDTLLAEQHQRRHIALSIPHFLAAPGILAQTDLVATLAARIAHPFAQTLALQVLPLPLPLPGFAVAMRWHQSTDTTPACQWLRQGIAQIASTL